VNPHTTTQYQAALSKCRDVLVKKNADYGTSWRVLRLSSIADQIFIKAKRIRTIEEKGSYTVDEGVESEYIGIVNYCFISLIQLSLGISDSKENLSEAALLELYNREAQITFDLMAAKNSDYGEAWREMKVSTFTDMILMRLLRIRQIEDNSGKTIMSEGIDANFRDMINYALFALIRLNE
jgi:hypothetical protein